MARYFQDYTLQDTPENSFNAIYQHLITQGYKYTQRKGEQVFQKGEGWLVAPTFVKVSYFEDRVRVEAWIMGAVLPGVFVGEMGMDGFMGWAAKGP